MHSPIIRVINSFGRIIIDIIIFGWKKDVYYFWKVNKGPCCVIDEESYISTSMSKKKLDEWLTGNNFF